MELNNSEKLKAFLRKEMNRLNISSTNIYRTYFARKLLERISEYNDGEIIVKGSSAQIAYIGSLVRAITDIDLASINNYNEAMPYISSAIQESNNLFFEFAKGFNRTKTGIYKISLMANYLGIKQNLNIDFQDNYNRLLEKKRLIYPVIFENDKPFEVFVPSYEEYLAEKICIILESNKQDVLNTRVKDFYDIYELHGGKYDADKLSEYFGKMLKLRHKIESKDATTLILNKEFVDKHKEIWDRTVKKYDFMDHNIDFEGAVYYTRGVARDLLQRNGEDMPASTIEIFSENKKNR